MDKSLERLKLLQQRIRERNELVSRKEYMREKGLEPYERRSGATTEMLVQACAAAAFGKLVLIRAHSSHYETSLAFTGRQMLSRAGLGGEVWPLHRKRTAVHEWRRRHGEREAWMVTFTDHYYRFTDKDRYMEP